jgi:hypothetical protein
VAKTVATLEADVSNENNKTGENNKSNKKKKKKGFWSSGYGTAAKVGIGGAGGVLGTLVTQRALRGSEEAVGAALRGGGRSGFKGFRR